MPNLLACPICRNLLTRDPDSLRCPCSRYPVVEGIPVITGWAKNRCFTVEELLARHLPPPTGLAGKLLRKLLPPTGRLREAVQNPEATFLQLAEALGRVGDLDYFRYRFSDLSYIASAATVAPLARGPVLDLGCGAGHLVSALAKRIPKGLIAGLDLNYTLLYLARRFLAPDALLVCADAAARLPFCDGAFEGAVSADVFQYLPDLAATAAELLRVTRGPILLSHLWTPAPDRPRGLPPDRYRELFASKTPWLCGDRDLLETFLRTRSLDLTRPPAADEDSVTLVAGLERGIFPGADYFVSGSSINPLYESRDEGGKILLKRRHLSDAYAAAYRKYEEHFPESLAVTREQIAERDPGLVGKFVLLDLPPNYS
jgi:SAM-dependent methyltransferase